MKKISDLSACAASVTLCLAELISIYIDFLAALGSSWWAAVRNWGIRTALRSLIDCLDSRGP